MVDEKTKKTLGVHFFAAPCTFYAKNFICSLFFSIYWFPRNLVLKCVSQPEIAKNP